MKRITIFLAAVFGVMALTTSCNDEWTEEQYEHYISFKSPLDDKGGVTSVYVPYTRHNADGTNKYGVGISDYQLPVIVSGTTKNDRNFTVKIGHDTDTLSILNYEWFQLREDLFYKDMSDFASYPSTIDFKAGSDIALLPIKFDFSQGIDMVEKWVLPLMVVDDGTSPYISHPRKHYGKALLRVFPFNAVSGNYSATTLIVKTSTTTNTDWSKVDGSGQEVARAYVVSEDEVFFYAGTIDESRTDRKNYKIYAKFICENITNDGETGRVELYSKNPEMNFTTTGQATYKIYDRNDDIKPYLKHHYIIINNINYTFSDYTLLAPEKVADDAEEGTYDFQNEKGKWKYSRMWYNAAGTLTHERQINTQIADEDQAIDW